MSVAPTAEEVDRTYRKIAHRIVLPSLVVCFIAYIDFDNFALLKLQVLHGLSFSEASYRLGSVLFLATYVLFQIPSNLLFERLGPSVILALPMIVWGLISAGVAFVTTPVQFYLMRVLLGAAEAGFFPGILLYLSYWFPLRCHARVVSIIIVGGVLGALLGGPVSRGLAAGLDGLAGLNGWQLLFILEGLAIAALGVLAYFSFNGARSGATWLTDREKAIVLNNLQNGAARDGSAQPLSNPKTYLVAFAYMALLCAAISMAWQVQAVLDRIDRSLVWPSMGCVFILGLFGMYQLALDSDWTLERRWHFAGVILWAAACCIGLSRTDGSGVLSLALLAMAGCGIWISIPVFWGIALAYPPGTSRAVGIALINSSGAVGGFVGPALIDWATPQVGRPQSEFAVIAVMLIGAAAFVLIGKKPRSVNESRTK